MNRLKFSLENQIQEWKKFISQSNKAREEYYNSVYLILN
jgi:hypothetical protein